MTPEILVLIYIVLKAFHKHYKTHRECKKTNINVTVNGNNNNININR